MANVFRNIPSVNELLESPPLKRLAERANRNVVVGRVRDFLDNLRSEWQQATEDLHVQTPQDLAQRIADWISHEDRPALRPVINATGIVLHTGLGRAPLADAAIESMRRVAEGYCSLELDLADGDRGDRMAAVEPLLRRLTGAEGALVVNNNAAATVLALAALAAGREVIVSRGELVEIGGSFRLPDVMQTSGAKLREVGTTNRTRCRDYESAIGAETAALMRVHASNFAIVGFTERPTLAEMSTLARRHNLPLIDDVGSGALVRFEAYGAADEPVVSDSVRGGADLTLFSGDKLLGGPQCGVLVGKRNVIDRLRRHPLARAFRVDKLTLAALAATLALYEDSATLDERLPLLALLSTSVENLKHRAERMAPQMAASPAIESAEAIEDTAFVGGGSLPAHQIPTWCVALKPSKGSVDTLHARLRSGSPAVVGRVRNDRLLLDLRSVFPRQDIDLVAAVEMLTDANDASHEKPAEQTTPESTVSRSAPSGSAWPDSSTSDRNGTD